MKIFSKTVDSSSLTANRERTSESTNTSASTLMEFSQGHVEQGSSDLGHFDTPLYRHSSVRTALLKPSLRRNSSGSCESTDGKYAFTHHRYSLGDLSLEEENSSKRIYNSHRHVMQPQGEAHEGSFITADYDHSIEILKTTTLSEDYQARRLKTECSILDHSPVPSDKKFRRQSMPSVLAMSTPNLMARPLIKKLRSASHISLQAFRKTLSFYNNNKHDSSSPMSSLGDLAISKESSSSCGSNTQSENITEVVSVSNHNNGGGPLSEFFLRSYVPLKWHKIHHPAHPTWMREDIERRYVMYNMGSIIDPEGAEVPILLSSLQEVYLLIAMLRDHIVRTQGLRHFETLAKFSPKFR